MTHVEIHFLLNLKKGGFDANGLLFSELMGHYNQTIVSHNLTENQKGKNSRLNTRDPFCVLAPGGVSLLHEPSSDCTSAPRRDVAEPGAVRPGSAGKQRGLHLGTPGPHRLHEMETDVNGNIPGCFPPPM